MLASNAASSSRAPEFVLSHVFDAPRERVSGVFTTLEAWKHGWGPCGFQWDSAKLDLRPNGMFHDRMRSPAGAHMWGPFVYREVVPPERLAFVHSFSDENGGITGNPWMAEWPREVLHTVTFTESDREATVTMRGVPVNATEAERKTLDAGRDSMPKGFAGPFEQFAQYLASGRTGEMS